VSTNVYVEVEVDVLRFDDSAYRRQAVLSGRTPSTAPQLQGHPDSRCAGWNGHRNPSMLPGGRGVLFTISANTTKEQQVAVLDLKSGQQRTLLRGGVAAEYVDTGHLV
jgi:hypothetical protein